MYYPVWPIMHAPIAHGDMVSSWRYVESSAAARTYCGPKSKLAASQIQALMRLHRYLKQ